jgi:hypothetical protein
MSDKPKTKPILSVDFDGVIHGYESGWQGADVANDPPVLGAMQFLLDAIDKFDVHIYSARSHQTGGIECMRNYIQKHMLALCQADLDPGTDSVAMVRHYVDTLLSFPCHKPPALISIDDRAMQFTGEWPVLSDLLAFKPWNKKDV